MKKVFILALFVITLVCCGQRRKENNKKELTSSSVNSGIQDSIKAAHDSILLIEGDKAIGGLNFGISKAEYIKQGKALLKSLKDSKDVSRIGEFIFEIYFNDGFNEYSNYNNLTAYDKESFSRDHFLSDRQASFYKDSLFSFHLDGERFPIYQKTTGVYYDRNNEINAASNSIIHFFQTKYGKPTETNKLNGEWRDKRGYKKYYLAKWNIGYKSYNVYVDINNVRGSDRDPDYAQVVVELIDNKIVNKMLNDFSVQHNKIIEIEKAKKELDDKKNAEKMKSL